MFEDGKVKRIFVEESICNGCHMCEMMCSFVNTQSFSLQNSNIKIINYEWKGRNRPLVSCDVESHASCRALPQCVAFCPTGAITWATKDEFASMVEDFQKNGNLNLHIKRGHRGAGGNQRRNRL